jgi:glycogen debranching enzyme
LTSFARSAAPVFCCLTLLAQSVPAPSAGVPKFPLRSGGLELQRAAHSGAFFDAVGHRSAVFGYENREAEAWVYPLEILDGLSFSFRLEGYPVELDGRSLLSSIVVRPEATTFVYAHAAFTIREIVMAPVDEPGVAILLDVRSVLPATITVSFRPRLRLMWPAPSMSPSIGWDPDARVYSVTEETGRYAGVIGCPLARDISIMPYQEEPRDLPNRFVIDASPSDLATHFVPIVITGSTQGRSAAKETYDRILGSIQALYDRSADYYDQLDRHTVSITTPDQRLDTAFRWAKVGIDKGVATNPMLGTGLLAGFRTAGESERPGFAWFFGRDALWTALATTAEGAFETTRTALEFLRKYQRQDGKIPHEISQSASVIPWFDQFPYAWASADATPLYVIAHADYWRASGDRAFITASWPSVLKAYQFSAATDTDGNGLIENTNVGHGWVEGGALYPPHEEMYMQGLWIAASRGIAELAVVMNDGATAAGARAAAERTRTVMEQTYWLSDRGFYAFATARPTSTPRTAEPGPNREARQARLNAMATARIVDEDTVLPAVPLWFGTTDNDRSQQEVDHLGGGSIATDWGSRILSNRSALYDPLSYHYGSVWPLFTGWTAVGSYRYGRPHVGYGAMMANALLTYPGALGYVTELLSGDFATPFGRSSHHQIWSEAMVVSPVIKGLLGIDVSDAARTLRFAPALPASWDRIEARNVAAGTDMYDFALERSPGREVVHVRRQASGAATEQKTSRRLVIAPAFPLDARITRVTVNGAAARPEMTRIGDEQRAQVAFDGGSAVTDVVFSYDEGTEVDVDPQVPATGAPSEGLRLLRAWADAAALHLRVEGRGGRAYVIRVRSPRRVGAADGVTVLTPAGREQRLEVRFEGNADTYVRRDITVALSAAR